MGANCCRGHKRSVQNPVIKSADDLRAQSKDRKDVAMDETREQPPNPILIPSEAVKRIDIVSMGSQDEAICTVGPPIIVGQDDGLSASNILWSTGSFTDPIPNGFYSLIRDDKLKNFESIPTLDEIYGLVDEGLNANVIVVDFEKDEKLKRLQQLIITLVGGSNSNPVKVIQKIATLVANLYNRPTLRNPTKTIQSFQSHGILNLGQVKHGSCRVRAILFKVLADTVGLESKLVVGFPSDLKASDDLYNHMSVVVGLNTKQMVVDLMRYPGQLIPLSTEAIYLVHISAKKKSPCRLPSEPNSDIPESPQQSPFIPSRTRYMLINDKKTVQEFSDDVAPLSFKSVEAAKLETERNRRLLNAIPEISDDIDRGLRVKTKSLKLSRFSKEQGDKTRSPDDLQKNVSGFLVDAHDQDGNNQSQSPLERSEPPSHQNISQIWNEVLGSPMLQNKPLLPFEEWNIDFTELKIVNRVGIGCFGEVFRGNWNGTDVAIKMLLEKDITAENMEVFCNEILILSRLRHPNVILLLGVCTKPPQLSLVTEYMEKGSLYYVLHCQKKKLCWKRKLNMLRDICRGMMHIHRMEIVHRDLKSANCLLSDNWKVKICDFGLSKMMKGTVVKDTVVSGTPEWMAPEVMCNEPLSGKCDIFSFGVITWELCTESKPWKGVPIQKVVYTVAKEGALLEIPEGPLAKLIAACWSEPEKRPSWEEILSQLAICEYSLC